MNEVMNLEQLEKLAKNPFYKLSKEQLALMEKLRNEKYAHKHPTVPNKNLPGLRIHKPNLEPNNGTS